MIARRVSFFIFSLAFVLASFPAKADAENYLIYVVLDKTNQMALLNPATRSIVSYTKLPVLGTHGVTFSPDKRYLYINAMPPADIVEYDIKRKGISKWFPIKEIKKNCGILIAPDGKTVISASQSKKVVIMDRITGSYKTVDTPADSHQFTFGPDGNIYVGGGKANVVSVIDWKKGKLLKKIKVGKVPHGVAFSPDNSKMLVSLRGENRVAVYDAKSNKEIDSIPIKVGDGGLCNIVLMPDKKTYWLAETFGRRLWQIDAVTHEILAHVDVDGEPHHAQPVMLGR